MHYPPQTTAVTHPTYTVLPTTSKNNPPINPKLNREDPWQHHISKQNPGSDIIKHAPAESTGTKISNIPKCRAQEDLSFHMSDYRAM